MSDIRVGNRDAVRSLTRTIQKGRSPTGVSAGTAIQAGGGRLPVGSAVASVGAIRKSVNFPICDVRAASCTSSSRKPSSSSLAWRTAATAVPTHRSSTARRCSRDRTLMTAKVRARPSTNASSATRCCQGQAHTRRAAAAPGKRRCGRLAGASSSTAASPG